MFIYVAPRHSLLVGRDTKHYVMYKALFDLGFGGFVTLSVVDDEGGCSKTIPHMLRVNFLVFFQLYLVPWVRSHLHSVGSHPSHNSSTARSFCMHLRGNSSLVGTNVTIPGHLKPLSSFGMWRNSINYLGNNESNVNLNIYNFDWLLSHWFPTGKSSHIGACKKFGQWRRRVKFILSFSMFNAISMTFGWELT